MAKLLDANVIIRYLTNDDASKAKKVEYFLKTSKEPLVLTDVSIAEIVWVLQSHYKTPKDEIVEKLQSLLALEKIEANKTVLVQAFDLFFAYNIDYIDAYLAAYALEHNLNDIVSYDRHLDSIMDIDRHEP